MERFTISKSEKQTLYEIYRACRLCGAGGGYRMPIIQNIIDLDNSEVELKQKIQECLQLEIHPDDRMPPLICELCVDKLNDFYAFLERSRQTNVRTRTRLGLPIQTTKKGEPASNDCILGVTEPVYVKEEDDTKKAKAGPKSSKKIKKEPDVVYVKTETSDSSRSSSVSSRSERVRARLSLPATASSAASASSPATAPAAASAPATRRKPERERAKDKPETPKDTLTPNQKKVQAARKRELENLLEKSNPKKVQAAKKNELEVLLEDNKKFSDEPLLAPRSLKRKESPPRPALLPKRSRTDKSTTKVPVKEPVKKEPVKKEPVKKEPAKKEPAKKEPAKKEPVKKEPVKEPSPPRSRPGPKSRKPVPVLDFIPVPVKVPKTKAKSETTKTGPTEIPNYCVVCMTQIGNAGSYVKHMKMLHTPTFTKPAQACDPCGKWFANLDESVTHHRYHRAATFPYHCRRCFDDFTTLPLYNEHIEKGLCVQDEQPQTKSKCEECWATFTPKQMAAHKCPGQGARPGGKCSKCARTYVTAKNLKKHESQCSQKKAGELIADPDVLRRLKPMQVRVIRCDALCARGQYVNVARVKPTYGLAKNYIYPYMKLPPVKTEPVQHTIPVALKREPATEYSHWDSDDSDSDTRQVPSLSTLAIKKLFSRNLLGKVARKRKKVKEEDFENEKDFNVSSDINDIINSLGDDIGSLGNDSGNGIVDRDALTAKIKDIIGCFDDCDASMSVDDNQGDNDESNNDSNVKSASINANSEIVNSDESTKEITEPRELNLEQSNISEEKNDTSSEPNVENNDSQESNISAANDTVLENSANHLVKEDVNNRIYIETDNPNQDEENSSNIGTENKQLEDDSVKNNRVDIETDRNDINILDSESRNPSENEENRLDIETETPNRNDENYRIDTETEHLNKNEGNDDMDIETETPKNNEENSLDIQTENTGVVGRPDTDSDVGYPDKKIDNSLQKSHENDVEAGEKEEPVNGIDHDNENSMEVDQHADTNKTNKDEVKQIQESPIKHSIDNLIGETDRNPNPEKYINEVISSIEDIIMNNPRNDERNEQNGQNEMDDRNLMNALDEQIGEKRLSDGDKITLEDLLPKENTNEEIENISDDDFNFDA